jgi:conjugal transfer pilus assembly protein TraU
MGVGFLLPSTMYADASCAGRFLNPILDVNWDMIFPIRIFGVKLEVGDGSPDSPSTLTGPVCFCPSQILNIPVMGIRVNYHEPLYIEEIAKTPGCLSSLGGLQLFSGFETEQTELQERANSASRWQVHWYEYPIFSVLDMFKDFLCMEVSGFALAYMTEIDPTWQDDAWGAIFAPQALLFANPFAQSVCAMDAISATTANRPIDDLFWCAGSWGSVYPLTGNGNASVDRLQSANLVGAKFIARLSEMGLLWQTVGEFAKCRAYIMPIWMKSQFSIDPVYPVVYHGEGMSIGAATSVWEYAPVETYPYEENLNQVIFQEQQCCMR